MQDSLEAIKSKLNTLVPSIKVYETYMKDISEIISDDAITIEQIWLSYMDTTKGREYVSNDFIPVDTVNMYYKVSTNGNVRPIKKLNQILVDLQHQFQDDVFDYRNVVIQNVRAAHKADNFLYFEVGLSIQ